MVASSLLGGDSVGGEMVWWRNGLVARWFGGEMTVNLKTALTQSYASILEGAFS